MSPASRVRPTADADRRAWVNLLNGTTLLGRLAARLGRAKVCPGPRGLVLAEGYRLRFPVAGAFTVGNVVLTASSFDALERACPGVLGHEERHVDQYARWGLLFFPAYAIAAGWSWLRYRDWAVGNRFERQAGLITGHYWPAGQPRPRASRLRMRRER